LNEAHFLHHPAAGHTSINWLLVHVITDPIDQGFSAVGATVELRIRGRLAHSDGVAASLDGKQPTLRDGPIPQGQPFLYGCTAVRTQSVIAVNSGRVSYPEPACNSLRRPSAAPTRADRSRCFRIPQRSAAHDLGACAEFPISNLEQLPRQNQSVSIHMPDLTHGRASPRIQSSTGDVAAGRPGG
jgi:hypothetical protein